MYAKVPEDLKVPVLKELKQARLKSALKYFPALTVIFSILVALGVYFKGHLIIEMLLRHFQLRVSDTMLMIVGLGIVVVLTSGVLIFFLRQEYRECEYQELFYCQKCHVVDVYENGSCTLCQTRFTERASFIFTNYKNEERIIERWGLHTFNPTISATETL
jgi:hypothetical protein